MAKGKRSIFTPKYPEKYTGTYPITSRSSWEWYFMQMCDTNPNVLEWAWEPYKIPYTDPTRARQSIYIPDGFLKYREQNGSINQMLVEIKPAKEAMVEKAKSKLDQTLVMKNQAKWAAAAWWCDRRGIEFRILTENELFGDGKKSTKIHIQPTQALKSKVKPSKRARVLKYRAIIKSKKLAAAKKVRYKSGGKIKSIAKIGRIKSPKRRR